MRYDDLQCINPNTGKPTLHYTSYPGGLNGQYDPGALNIMLDLYIYPQATPMGNSTIVVEGVDPVVLSNAQSFANQTIELRAGMGPGLPLANPAQAGLILQGEVFQVFGNWEGAEQNIAFVVIPSPYTLSNPGNIVLNWTAGTPLATALTNTLQTAYPNATLRVNVSNTVLSHTEVHACATLTQLAQFLSGITTTDLTITANGSVITVADNIYKPAPKTLVFTDFIGQPMWLKPNQIQIRTVLRSDVQVNDIIQMPQGFSNMPGFVQTTQQSLPSLNNYKSAIQGQFTVTDIRHVGNLRQPNGNAWCTIINAAVSASP